MEEYNIYLSTIKNPNTLRSYRNSINELISYFHIDTIDDYNNLQLLDFETFLDYIYTRPAKSKAKKYSDTNTIRNNSYNALLRNVKAFSAWLKAHDMSENDHLRNIKFKREEKLHPISLLEEERQAMMKTAKSLDAKVSIGLMLYMGLRNFEVLRVKVSDIKDGKLNINGKGDKKVRLEIPPFLDEMIKEYLATRQYQSEYLILSKVGGHKVGNTNSLYGRVKRIAKKAGIPEEKLSMVATHTCRRTYACRAVENGVPPYIVKDMMRHASFQTTERYLAAMGNDASDKAIRNQPVPDWR